MDRIVHARRRAMYLVFGSAFPYHHLVFVLHTQEAGSPVALPPPVRPCPGTVPLDKNLDSGIGTACLLARGQCSLRGLSPFRGETTQDNRGKFCGSAPWFWSVQNDGTGLLELATVVGTVAGH